MPGVCDPGNSIYVGLATAVSDAEAGSLTEVNTSTQDANYTRQQVNAAGLDTGLVFDRPADSDQRSQHRIFCISGVATYTVTHAFVADASTGGNILFVGALDASKAIASGDIFRINAGNLTIELK